MCAECRRPTGNERLLDPTTIPYDITIADAQMDAVNATSSQALVVT